MELRSCLRGGHVNTISSNFNILRSRRSEALGRIYVAPIRAIDNLPTSDGQFGFCAVNGKLEYQDAPLVFRRVPGVGGSTQREDVALAWELKSAEEPVNNELRMRFENAFRQRNDFESIEAIISRSATEYNDMDSVREIRILLVTALDEEFNDVKEEFTNELQEVSGESETYYEGMIWPTTRRFLYHLFLVRSGDTGSVDAAVISTIAALEFRPHYIVLLGITGGRQEKIKQLGNVVYGSSYTAYEYEKWGDGEPANPDRRPRPRLFGADDKLLQMAQAVNSGENWRASIRAGWFQSVFGGQGVYRIRAFKGHVMTGCKVIATREILRTAADHHDEVAAVEMESEGVHKSSQRLGSGFIMIKGISDWADPDKGRKGNRNDRRVATIAAAKFLRHGLTNGNSYPK